MQLHHTCGVHARVGGAATMRGHSRPPIRIFRRAREPSPRIRGQVNAFEDGEVSHFTGLHGIVPARMLPCVRLLHSA